MAMKAIRHSIKKATSTPKGKIIFFGILSVLLAAIAGGVLYWSIYKKQIIRNKLEKAIRDKSKGLYNIKYDELKLDEIAGDLSVNNLTLRYDSVKYLALATTDQAPSTLLNITVPSINVWGVKTPRALLNKEVVGKKLQINNPVIEIIYTDAGKDSSKNIPAKEVYEQILGDLDLIKVDTLIITGASIITRNINSGKVKTALQDTYVQLLDVAVDSAADADKSRLLFSKSIAINCASLKWLSDDGMYNFNIDSLSLQSVNKTISFQQFTMKPVLSEDAFTKTLRFATDRFHLSVTKMKIINTDFQKLFNEEIFADSIMSSSSFFHIYRDITIPRDKLNRVGTYPQQALAKMKMPVHIKNVVLNNSNIEYKEKNPKTKQAGKVQFNNSYVVVTNVTNIPALVKENNLMTADVNCSFLSKVPVHVTWQFFLSNPKGRFNVKGTMKSVDASAFNIITKPMGAATIDRGKINGLNFDLAGHDYGMDGTVKLLYDDLKVSILEKDEETKKFEKKKIASFAANVIIKNSNPSKKDEPRVIQVHFDRDTNRSMFHMAWKTLFKGIKETAGIKK